MLLGGHLATALQLLHDPPACDRPDQGLRTRRGMGPQSSDARTRAAPVPPAPSRAPPAKKLAFGAGIRHDDAAALGPGLAGSAGCCSPGPCCGWLEASTCSAVRCLLHCLLRMVLATWYASTLYTESPGCSTSWPPSQLSRTGGAASTMLVRQAPTLDVHLSPAQLYSCQPCRLPCLAVSCTTST